MILTQHTQAPAASFETACRRYRAGRLLKTAPDSSTYEGSRVRTRVPVTLKVMNSEGGRHRAVRMAEILASIRHPNLDILVDVTENPDGRPVVVLDARQGVTLELLRQTYRRLPALRAVHIARQVLDGLDAIHQTGHLHAMIRPASVLVDSAPGFEDHVTLIDIGAQQISTDPRYAAPEVVQGLVPDPSSDIYSVGAILYELLSGAPPDINAPCSLKQKIPTCPRLATLVDSALAARPEDRPQTASELSYQLQQLDLATLARANWSEDVTQPNVSWIDPAASQIASFGARQPLWATQRPSIWVLTGDPAIDKPAVQHTLRGLPAEGIDAEVIFLDAEGRRDRAEELKDSPPPWLLLFGDLHVLTTEPLLTAVAGRFAELSRVLVSTQKNVELIQSAVNLCGLDSFLTLPLGMEATVEAVNRMLERTRALRLHYDSLRMALRDAQEDIERAIHLPPVKEQR